jgi:hypothetical protein
MKVEVHEQKLVWAIVEYEQGRNFKVSSEGSVMVWAHGPQYADWYNYGPEFPDYWEIKEAGIAAMREQHRNMVG